MTTDGDSPAIAATDGPKYRRTPPETFTDRQCVEAYVLSAAKSPSGRCSTEIAAKIVSEATGKNCTRSRVRKANDRSSKGLPDPYHGDVVGVETPDAPGHAKTLEALAAVLGYDPSHVGRKARTSRNAGFAGDPFPQKVPGKGYPIAVCEAWWSRHIDKAFQSRESVGERGDGDGPAGLGGSGDKDPTGLNAMERKRAADADIAEMKAREMRGELIDIGAVEQALEVRARHFVAVMHKARPTFAKRLANLTSSGADAVLKDFIDHVVDRYGVGSLVEDAAGTVSEFQGAA